MYELKKWDDKDLMDLSMFLHKIESKGLQLPIVLEEVWSEITEEIISRK